MPNSNSKLLSLVQFLYVLAGSGIFVFGWYNLLNHGYYYNLYGAYPIDYVLGGIALGMFAVQYGVKAPFIVFALLAFADLILTLYSFHYATLFQLWEIMDLVSCAIIIRPKITLNKYAGISGLIFFLLLPVFTTYPFLYHFWISTLLFSAYKWLEL